jgi:hypothetical protein
MRSAARRADNPRHKAALDGVDTTSLFCLPSSDAQNTAVSPVVGAAWLAARYRKCFPSGRNAGQRCVVYLSVNFVTTAQEFLPSPIPGRWASCIEEKTRWSRSHPRMLHARSGASQMMSRRPAAMSMRFSLPSAKKPIERLSGDQKGKVASSVPGNRLRRQIIHRAQERAAAYPAHERKKQCACRRAKSPEDRRCRLRN